VPDLVHPAMMVLKRRLITIVKFGLSIAILAYLFNKASQDDQFSQVFAKDKNWGWLLTGFVACLFAHVLGFVRWRVMVRALELPFSLVDAIRVGFMGLFFNLFAFGVIGGDALRAFYVTREMPNRKPEAIASVVADRLIGMLSMFLIATIAFQLIDISAMETSHPKKLATAKFIFQVVTAFTTIGFVGLAILCFTPSLLKTRLARKLLEIPRIGPLASKMISVILVYRSRPLAVLASFFISFAINLAFAIAIFAIAVGILGTCPDFVDHFLIAPITMVSNAIPLPGGLGGMEFALDFLYQAFDCEQGVVVAFTFRFSILVVSAIGAVVWFLNRSKVEKLLPHADETVCASA
jgi:uncharacterized protein (TIRG00374 family)